VLALVASLLLGCIPQQNVEESEPSSNTSVTTVYEEFFSDDRISYEGAIIQDGDEMVGSTRAYEMPSYLMQRSIQRLVDNVSKDNVYNNILTLQNFGSRLYRSSGAYNATIWLNEVMKNSTRLNRIYHNWTVDRGALGVFQLSNVILELPGLNTSSDVIYDFYAHFDCVQTSDMPSILTNAPGADDDASGCAAILEAARIMSNHSFQDTIRFVFLQAEEIGLVGADYWTANITSKGENVQGGICYDMIGYNSGTYSYDLELIYNSASSSQATLMAGANTRYNIGMNLEMIQTASSIPSDINEYYTSGLTSVFGIEEDWSPYYHTTNDLAKWLNKTHLQQTTQMAVGSLCEMARLMWVDTSVPTGGLTLSDMSPDESDLVDVNVTVLNTGTTDAKACSVVFLDNGAPFDTKIIDVAAGSTNITSAVWTAVGGTHNISVVLDPLDLLFEADEFNNTAWVSVDVNDMPVAFFTVLPNSPLTGETVTLDGSFSTDIFGGVVEYEFDLGDGNTTGWINSNTTTHSYPQDGTYTVGLRVKDSNGLESVKVTIDLDVLNRAPVADPGSNLTNTLTLIPIKFWSNATDADGIVNLTWDFDDGESSYEPDPVHAYSKSGNHVVNLTVADDDGAKIYFDLDITVLNRGPTCLIDADTLTGNVTTEFTFNAVASDLDGTIATYEWDFTDVTYEGSTVTKTHTFATVGEYLVTLTVTDDEGAEAMSNITITIIDLPPVAAGSVTPLEVLTFEDVEYDAAGSADQEGDVEIFWTLGDGNVSDKETFEYAYSWPGTYTIQLSVEDTAGQFDNLTWEIVVNNRPPEALIEHSKGLLANSTIQFEGTGSTDPEGEIAAYSWDLGDGGKSSDAEPDYAYAAPGTYEVTLEVTDLHGAKASATMELTILPEGSIIQPDDDVEPDDDIEPDDDTQDDDDDDSGDTSTALYLGISAFFVLLIIIAVIVILIIVFVLKKKKKVDEPEGQPPPPLAPPPVQQAPPMAQQQTPPPQQPATQPPVQQAQPPIMAGPPPTAAMPVAQQEQLPPGPEATDGSPEEELRAGEGGVAEPADDLMGGTATHDETETSPMSQLLGGEDLEGGVEPENELDPTEEVQELEELDNPDDDDDFELSWED